MFIFLIVVGKSAQLGLHTWLPDAMEGPTPVSALIQAATMVTAGVFLIIRTSLLFESSQLSLIFIITLGSLTAFFSATIGLVQNDIKKIIAYSTCNLLGYMGVVCGASNFSVSLYLLVNHAFFKALLFLGAGSIIQVKSNEQDIRKMGGLIKNLPLTYFLLAAGSLSLIGFPFLTGFPVLYVWLIGVLAETPRAPFDFVEVESELVFGLNLKFLCGSFVLFLLDDY